jgi:hypothetical protein
MTKQATIDLIKTQLPGFYSADQVIELISKINENPTIDRTKLLKIIDIAKKAVATGMNQIDWENCDYTLDLEGREIILDSIKVYPDEVEDEVESALGEFFEEEFDIEI